MNDVDLKDKGNKYFSQRRYDDAIRCYSEAITMKPGVCIYYTNRALCHLKCRRWERVCQDCRTALEIDPMQVKAHFFLGQALLETQSYDECIKHFQRAQDLAKEQKVNYGDDIASLIRVARKKRFTIAEEARVAQEIELQSYLNRLILEDRDRQLAKLQNDGNEGGADDKYASNVSSSKSSHKPLSHRQPCTHDKENRRPLDGHDTDGANTKDDHPPDTDAEQMITAEDKATDNQNEANNTESLTPHPLSMEDDTRGSSGEQQLSAQEIMDKADDYLTEVNNMFAKLDDRRRKREVPDYLCGKISFDVLRDPVVSPSGITYDRKDIEEHLQRVGHFDPITRTKLTVDMLVPNLAIKEVVDAFLEENEWALDY